jgi:hypothetical protein
MQSGEMRQLQINAGGSASLSLDRRRARGATRPRRTVVIIIWETEREVWGRRGESKASETRERVEGWECGELGKAEMVGNSHLDFTMGGIFGYGRRLW